MKILFVSPQYDLFHYGGLAVSCGRIARSLAEAKNEVTVVNIDAEHQYIEGKSPAKEVEEYLDKKAKVIRVPQFYSHTGIKMEKGEKIEVKMWQWYLYLKNWITKNKPDVLISFFIVPHGYTLALLSREFNIPLISAIRGNDIGRFMHDPVHIPLVKHTLEASAVVTTLSKDLATQVKTLYPKAKTKVIYNSVNPEFYNKKWSEVFSKKEIKVGSVGVYKPKKGIEVLIRAFKTEKIKNCKLLLVGDFVKSTTKKEDYIDKNIEITGILPREKAVERLNEMDIYVTLTYSDGCPNAVLEAMCAGRCIITTHAAAMDDLLKDKRDALFVEEITEEAISEKVNYLIKNTNLAKKLSKNIRMRAKELFPPYEANEWMRMIKKVVK